MISRRGFLKVGLGTSLALMLPQHFYNLYASSSAVQTTRVITRGRNDLPQVCITYDDCWDEEITLKIAETYARHDLRLTFFPAGLAIQSNMDWPKPGTENLYQVLYDMGHEFACHLYYHIDITDKDTHYLYWWEIKPWYDALNEALGFEYTPVAIRPPMGIITDPLLTMAVQESLPVVLWSSDMRDSFCDHAYCEDESLRQFEADLRPGAIFLQHTVEPSLNIIERQLEMLEEAGIEPVPLSAMLAAMDGVEESEDSDAPVEPTTPGNPFEGGRRTIG